MNDSEELGQKHWVGHEALGLAECDETHIVSPKPCPLPFATVQVWESTRLYYGYV